MMSTLLMKLEGPMQSWGVQSRFGIRETGLEPSKSGVVGLLCAALGKPRYDEETETADCPALSRLANLRMGVRVDRAGVMLRDYHTVGGRHGKEGQSYGIAVGRNKRGDVIIGDTVVSDRFYLADACFLVGLEARTPEDEMWFGRLHEGLRRPRWQLSLGRKAFVPSAPVWLPDGLSPLGLVEALRSYKPLSSKRADAGDEPRMMIDVEVGDAEAEARRDVPLSFAERRFTVRYVKEVWRDE